MRIPLLISLLLTTTLTASAADPFKTAKAALKTGANIEAAETAIVTHARSTDTPPSDRAKAFNVAAQLSQRIYAAENEKIYLKKPFDTLRYFNAIHRVFEHTMRCDSIESQPDERGRLRTAFRKDNRQMRDHHRRNLLEGAKWLMRKRQFPEAARFFCTYQQADSALLATDTLRSQIAVWTTKCAFASGNMPLTLQYVDRAMLAGDSPEVLLEYKARAQLAVADTAGWESTLDDGTRRFPAYVYFFASLNARLRERNRFDDALALTRRMIAACPDTVLYRQALCRVFFDLNQPDSCIAASDEVITRRPDAADAYFAKGVSWVRKAERFAETACYDMRLPKCREDRKRLMDMYAQARPPLEEYRRLAPDAAPLWAPALYKVYYALNMGEELSDVEQFIRQ